MKRALFSLVCLLAVTAPAHAQPQTTYEQEVVAAVQLHFDAYRSWNIDRFVATFAQDAMVMVDGKAAVGHAQIRAFYAANFADVPHTIRVVESSIRGGMVHVTVAYTFGDGQERCCSYSEYAVENGKITFLAATMSNRM